MHQPAAVGGSGIQRSTHQVHPLGQAAQPVSRRPDRAGARTAAGAPDVEHKVRRAPGQGHPDASAGSGVLGGVRQRLLDDAVGGLVDAGVQLPCLPVDDEGDVEPTAAGPLDELVHGGQLGPATRLGGGPAVGGAQQPEHPVQLVHRLGSGSLDDPQGVVHPFLVRAQLGPRPGGVEDHGGHRAGDAVVQLARQSQPLGLQRTFRLGREPSPLRLGVLLAQANGS